MRAVQIMFRGGGLLSIVPVGQKTLWNAQVVQEFRHPVLAPEPGRFWVQDHDFTVWEACKAEFMGKATVEA